MSTLIGSTVERLGSVDMLINNAGISIYGETKLTLAEDFHSVMSVNFFGAVQCMSVFQKDHAEQRVYPMRTSGILSDSARTEVDAHG